jgi:acetone carboxylase gamma subunit
MNREIEMLVEDRKVINRRIRDMQDGCGHFPEHRVLVPYGDCWGSYREFCTWCGRYLCVYEGAPTYPIKSDVEEVVT